MFAGAAPEDDAAATPGAAPEDAGLFAGAAPGDDPAAGTAAVDLAGAAPDDGRVAQSTPPQAPQQTPTRPPTSTRAQPLCVSPPSAAADRPLSPAHLGKQLRWCPALQKHLEGREEARPREAIERRGVERSIDLGAEPERARLVVGEALAARAATRKGGRPPLQCIDVLMSGPPPWDAPDAWPLDRVKDWGNDAVTWLRSVLPPDTPLETAHLHTDETSPHLHGAFPPALADAKGVTALSWKRVNAYMAAQAAVHPVKPGPAEMRALQQSYFENVGRKYGLGRGKVGARIEYAPLDRTEGLKRRTAGAEARAVEERERRSEAEKQAADAEKELKMERRRKERAEADAKAFYDDAVYSLGQTNDATAAQIAAEKTTKKTSSAKHARPPINARPTPSRRAPPRRPHARPPINARPTPSRRAEKAARKAADQRAADAEQKSATEKAARKAADQRAADAEQKSATEKAARTTAEKRADNATTALDRMALKLDIESGHLDEERGKRAAAERAANSAVTRVDELEWELYERHPEPNRGAALVRRQRQAHADGSASRRSRPRHTPPPTTDRRTAAATPATRTQTEHTRPDPPGRQQRR